MGNSKNVAEIKPKEVALAEAFDAEIEKDLDTVRSIDQLNNDAFSLPQLKLLQPLSPEVSKKMEGYVEGAKPGMFYNTVSGKLYAGPILVIPAVIDQNWLEWVPKDKGGGFVAQYPAGHPRINEAKMQPDWKNVLPNGNLLEETHQHYVVIVDPEDGTFEQVLINMKNTQRKESRRWNTMIRAATMVHKGELKKAPEWAYAYILGREEAANDKGSWFKWSVKGRSRSTAEQWVAGRELAKTIAGQPKKIDLSQYAEEDEAGLSTARVQQTYEAPATELDDNDIPFDA